MGEDFIVVRPVLYNGIDEIIHEIADRKGVFGSEMQVFGIACVVKVSFEEIVHDRVVADVVQNIFQKRVGGYKIDSDILRSRFQNGMSDMSV